MSYPESVYDGLLGEDTSQWAFGTSFEDPLAGVDTTLPDDVNIRVVSTCLETRYLVIPVRPTCTEGWTVEQLQEIVTKDCLIGVALPQVP